MNNKTTSKRLIFTNDCNITKRVIIIILNFHISHYIRTLAPLGQIGVDSVAITVSYSVDALKQKDNFDTAILPLMFVSQTKIIN